MESLAMIDRQAMLSVRKAGLLTFASGRGQISSPSVNVQFAECSGFLALLAAPSLAETDVKIRGAVQSLLPGQQRQY